MSVRQAEFTVLGKKAFFYACDENLTFFHASVEKFYAYGHVKRVISAHSISALTLKLTGINAKPFVGYLFL